MPLNLLAHGDAVVSLCSVRGSVRIMVPQNHITKHPHMHAYIDASIHSTIGAERKDKETNGTREPSYVAFLVHPDGDELSDGGWLHIYSSPSVSNTHKLNVSPIISIRVAEAFVHCIRLGEGVTSQWSITGDVEGLISPSVPKRASHTLSRGHPTTSISIWYTSKWGPTIQRAGVEEGYNGLQRQSVKNQRW